MTLLVKIPRTGAAEHTYVVKVIFTDLLKIPCSIEKWDQNNIGIFHEGINSSINFPSYIIPLIVQKGKAAFNQIYVEEIPTNLLPQILRVESVSGIKALATRESPTSNSLELQSILNFDVFGTAFCLLTRAEERLLNQGGSPVISPSPSLLDLQLKDRPHVDYYCAILAEILNFHLGQAIYKYTPNNSLQLTVDIDRPLLFEEGSLAILRRFCGELFKRQSPHAAISLISNYIRKLTNKTYLDPFDTFDFLLDLGEKFKKQIIFFVPSIRRVKLDPIVNCQNPSVLPILKKILDRGHIIGIHGSIGASSNSTLLSEEIEVLSDSLKTLGHEQAIEHGRQHYLSFDPTRSVGTYSEAGLSYDFSLGWAQHFGFRCGTGNNFHLFDPVKNQTSNTIEFPLILMDGALGKPGGMKNEYRLEVGKRLLNYDKNISNAGNILWHNDWLANSSTENWILDRLLDNNLTKS